LVEPPLGWRPARVSYDTSRPLPGHLIVLRNPWSWRKDLVDDAPNLAAIVNGGAVGAVLQEEQRPWAAALPPTFPLLLVPSTFRALQDLARAARRRFAGKLVAVTGTAGKTTTREMLRLVLDRQGGAAGTRRNDNNVAGVYRSMSLIPRDHPFGIIELGFGPPLDWISHGSRVVRPHVALFTSLGLAHLDAFGDAALDEPAALRRIAAQKLGILDGAQPGATLVLCRELPLFDEIQASAREKVAAILTYGEHEAADVRLVSFQPSRHGGRIVADYRGSRFEFTTRVPLRAMALNALGVLAAVDAVGGDLSRAATDLTDFEPVDGRAQVLPIPVPGGTATLLNDSFNATPLSVATSLELLSAVELPPGGRRLAAFGDINHLGPRAAEIHTGLAETLARHRIDRVFTHGRLMRHLNDALPRDLAAPHADSLDELHQQIRAELRPGDAITLKASTTVGLGRVARALRDDREMS
jgi:UDP-N-acetylmuramoyl-tripeptide--D-alanyl-D-alanine ligase